MKKQIRRYLVTHVLLLAVALSFAGYALLMRRLFPAGYFDCVMGDLLHLYCPFCGGTRALLALLAGDLKGAFTYHALLLPLGALLLVADGITFFRLCRGVEARYPAVLWRVAFWALLFFFLLRNALMLWGIDPTGDHAVHWTHLPRLAAALFLPLATACVVALLFAVLPPVRLACYRPLATTAALLLFTALLALLLCNAFLCFAALPVLLGAIAYAVLKSKKENRI